MNHLTRLAVACVSGLALSACSSLGTGEYGYSSYALVRVRQVNVGDGSLTVTPPRPYNRHRASCGRTSATSRTGRSTGPISTESASSAASRAAPI